MQISQATVDLRVAMNQAKLAFMEADAAFQQSLLNDQITSDQDLSKAIAAKSAQVAQVLNQANQEVQPLSNP